MNIPFKVLSIAAAGSLWFGLGAPAIQAETVYPVATGANVVSAVPIATLASSGSIQVTAKSVKEDTDLVHADLSIPVIRNLKDSRYQAELNDIIERQAMKDLEQLKKQAAEDAVASQAAGYTFRPYGLTLRYEVKADGGEANGNVLSLKLVTYTYTGGAHGIQRLDTYNVRDEQEAQRVELKDLFGEDYKKTIDASISAQIAEKPENYFPDTFKGISNTTNFYLDQGNAVIVFQPYEIAPYAAGMPEFRIALPGQPGGTGSGNGTGRTDAGGMQALSVNGKPLGTVEAAVYIQGVSVQMVPLRPIAEALGYEVKWNDEQQSAELTRGPQWTSVTVGKNAYTYLKTVPIALGAAPEIRPDGRMYVPLSFFAEIAKADVKAEGGTISIRSK
ncbi:DUF4163 domain-containing protein [Paenibacillus filicis]|uniref:DUF4163 domain-containing protein n=1 Tax=Paenibacillus gyeongsangnamensis TaxID=3388067 RepID=A0ABT4QGD8_9BACL|nr:DUF3298 domain-containing protein [Paenibacillus filicis]MCZ8515933.1 DUF4163 domain-containing protein [Paenibacillus filicis]